MPTAPSPRVLVSGHAGRDHRRAVRRSPAAPSCRRRGNGPCVTGQWIVGAVRVLSLGQPLAIMTGISICVPDGHAAAAGVGADAGARDVRSNREHQRQFPVSVRRARPHDGRAATTTCRQLVEQVLFTSPGERVNLPDFGSGLLQLPFAPNSVEMAAATQFTVQAALQKWLSNYIKVQSVVATAKEAVLTVTVTYSLLNTMSPRCRPSSTGATRDLPAAATKTARPRCSATRR